MSANQPGALAREGRAEHPARAELVALAERGVSWAGYASRVPPAATPGRPAAVLVLFGVLDGAPAGHAGSAVRSDLDVLLVGRATTLTHHSGQVAFPGGRLDPGDSGPVAGAIREAVEETGLDAAGVEVLAALGELGVPVSNHVVTPVLAWWSRPSPVGVVDTRESAAVFRAPVADLLDPANRRTALYGRASPVRGGPAFLVGTHVVWGFTALVLDTLFDQLGWTQDWDRDRTMDAPIR